MKNILSIDFESWIHARESHLKLPIPRRTPAEARSLDNGFVPRTIDSILETLARRGHTATFFVVAEIYDWYPKAIEEIEASGHEIGYHTHSHVVLDEPGLLERQLEQSRAFLERFRPLGFRAPELTISRGDIELLDRYGFAYSSSSYELDGIEKIGGVDEIPVSTLSVLGLGRRAESWPKRLTVPLLMRKFPVGCGLFIALLGPITRQLVRRMNARGRSAVLFVHPWQITAWPELGPAHRARVLRKNPLCLPYTLNIAQTFERLVDAFEFESFRDSYYGGTPGSGIHGRRRDTIASAVMDRGTVRQADETL